MFHLEPPGKYTQVNKTARPPTQHFRNYFTNSVIISAKHPNHATWPTTTEYNTAIDSMKHPNHANKPAVQANISMLCASSFYRFFVLNSGSSHASSLV